MMMMMIVIQLIRLTYRMYVQNKRSGSSLCLRERKLAHFVGLNIMVGTGEDCQQQQQQRKQIVTTTTTTMMMIVIRPIGSTYRMYVRNKFVHFDLLLNFIIQEEMETETKDQ